MNLGNILPSLEQKFGIAIDTEQLMHLYHSGELKPFLPDGCAWFVVIGDEGPTSLASMATAEAKSQAAQHVILQLPSGIASRSR